MKSRSLLVLLSFTLSFSCAGTERFKSPNKKANHSDVQIQSALQKAAERWLGVPYRFGGNNRQGIDCSGLVVQLYKEVFGLRLPHSAKQQRTLGYAVHLPYLKAGDLLFFRFKKDEGIEHVGIYLGHNQFVHASQTRGVVIDSLNTPYYLRHLVVIRRVRD